MNGTHLVDVRLRGLLQGLENDFEIFGKIGADGEGDVAEDGKNVGLDGAVDGLAGQAVQQQVHQFVAMRQDLLADGAANVADDAHRRHAHLR